MRLLMPASSGVECASGPAANPSWQGGGGRATICAESRAISDPLAADGCGSPTRRPFLMARGLVEGHALCLARRPRAGMPPLVRVWPPIESRDYSRRNSAGHAAAVLAGVTSCLARAGRLPRSAADWVAVRAMHIDLQ